MVNNTDSIYFSIVIPLYNKEFSVKSTVESLLNQTYPNFELIIVNDGSTDNSLEVVKQFKDPRVKLIKKENGGVSSARNTGIQAAKYDYIIPLDADDLWMPFALSEFVYLIKNFSDAQVFCTSCTITDKDRKGTAKRYYIDDYYYYLAVFLAKWSIPIMVTGTVAIKKACFNEIGLYDESVFHGEDEDLWDRLKDNYRIAKSELVTMVYRLDAENRASNMSEEKKTFKYSGEFPEFTPITNSQKLYNGTLNFINVFTGTVFRDKKPIQTLLKIKWYWVLKAAILFIKYRLPYPFCLSFKA